MPSNDSGGCVIFDRESWPRYGRIAISRETSSRFQVQQGQVFLVIPEIGDLWMVYEAGPDGSSPRSDFISQSDLDAFSSELGLTFLVPGHDEEEVEKRVFGLRDYWRQHNRY